MAWSCLPGLCVRGCPHLVYAMFCCYTLALHALKTARDAHGSNLKHGGIIAVHGLDRGTLAVPN